MRNLVIISLVLAYLVMAVVANVSFKRSAGSSDWRGFLQWQVVGNVAGFCSVLSLTGLLRYIPLHLAYTFTMGLGFVAVQVFGARLIFHEAITTGQWMGTALIAGGIVLVSLSR